MNCIYVKTGLPDRTKGLLPRNGDLCSQQDRDMGFCEFNQIRPIRERTLSACLRFVPLF